MPAVRHEFGKMFDESVSFAIPMTSSGVLASNVVRTSISTALASSSTRARSMSVESLSMSAVTTLTSAAGLSISTWAPSISRGARSISVGATSTEAAILATKIAIRSTKIGTFWPRYCRPRKTKKKTTRKYRATCVEYRDTHREYCESGREYHHADRGGGDRSHQRHGVSDEHDRRHHQGVVNSHGVRRTNRGARTNCHEGLPGRYEEPADDRGGPRGSREATGHLGFLLRRSRSLPILSMAHASRPIAEPAVPTFPAVDKLPHGKAILTRRSIKSVNSLRQQ
jgi:hypothetical protein